MKVYLVHKEYYDYNERTYGSVLLGIYSSKKLALKGRDDFYNRERNECDCMSCSYQTSIDYDNHPMITRLDNNEPLEDCTFTIEEWLVQ